MAKVSPIQSNFNGGEISPLIFGRPDLDKYKTGLKSCQNFVPLLQGPVERRPGTKHINNVKASSKSTRIISFEFSTTQAYVIEVGDLYMRFYKNGARIHEADTEITGATAANPVVVTSNSHGYSDGDELYISDVVGMTELNGKNYIIKNKATNTYELTDLHGTNINGTGYTAYGSGGLASTPIELVTTYTEANLFELKFSQSADVLYITHPSYPPRKLTRTSHTAWTITNLTFLDGPYLNTNATATTFLLSATSGSVNVTASAITGVNGGVGFLATDVGRSIRWKDAAGNWTWLTITARTSATIAVATIDGPNASATTATINWRLGVWSATTGYPAAATFHQDRLSFGGGVEYPQRVEFSRTGDFENMAPTEPDGTVVDDNGFSITLAADNVNAIRWMADDEKGLLIGTVGGEWVARPSDQGGLITPSNKQAKRSSSYGSADIEPVRAGRAMLFIQSAKRKMRELAYIFEDDGFRAPDMTLVAEHITSTGLVEIAWQSEPQNVMWGVLTDGTLTSMTYERDQSIIGWARHIMGGYSTSGAAVTSKVESVTVIPNSTGTADEVYIVVRRWINGASVRYVEFLVPYWSQDTDQEDAFYVDSGLSLDNPLVVTAATRANPCVVTATSHGFSNGDDIRITNTKGMIEINKTVFRIFNKSTNAFSLCSATRRSTVITAATAANPVVITSTGHGLANGDKIGIFDVVGMTELNGLGFTVAGVSANTFQLSGINGSSYTSYTSGGVIHNTIDSTAYTTYVADGEARKRVSSISGLNHLEGETVSILAEGAAHADKVVASGAITLDRETSKAHIGLAYESDFETLRPDFGAQDGTAQGKLVRMHRVIIRFYQSLGGDVGPDVDNLDELNLRKGGDLMDTAVALFTGDIEVDWEMEYSTDVHIYIRQNTPFPMTIEAVMPQMSTQDR
tara:strand:+ start:7541 stop:10294 length:2754 start_codon:yes stop_codon:yes gene_type:complete